jgi:hypothetical protein
MDIFEEVDKNGFTPAIIDFTNINKKALGSVSGALIDKVNAGEEDALDVFIKAKAIGEVAKGIMDGVKGLATDEAEKYEKGDNNILGCEFIVKSGATKYSFSHDDEWNNINEEIKALTEKRKSREQKMIDATKYAEVVDDTGELVPPAEILSNGSSILTINIPKS